MPHDLLFLPGFVSPGGDYKASDAVGYGITSVDAILAELPRHGVRVRCLRPEVTTGRKDVEGRRLSWILESYQALLREAPCDALFVFHAFQQFPQEIRRILADLGSEAAITGYTHGSHWDPTDLFRFIHYPEMELTDLANLLAMDRVCVVSEHMRDVLVANVARWRPETGERLAARLRVVGLPIHTAALDAARTDDRFASPMIVFNHSMVPAKEPGLFLDAAEHVLRAHDCQIFLTRDVRGSAVEARVAALRGRWPGRVHVGETLGVEAYFRLLWRADLQVSTARHESLGVSTLEAMYTETCCLLPNRGSYPEITGNFREVLYDSHEELCARLDHFLTHVEERRRVAATLRARALRYAPSRVVPRIAEVIAEAIEVSRRPRPARP
jgi:glycosyltransferase involved in cell wall biosynthesis